MSMKARDPKDITIAEVYLTSVEGVGFEYNSIGMLLAYGEKPKAFKPSVPESIAEAKNYRKQFEASKVEMTDRRKNDFKAAIELLKENLNAAETSGRKLNVPHTDEVISFYKDSIAYLEKFVD